ncbi:MAG: Trp family transcriptional regulator [Candidatus Roizmanbacteria bacterium]|nr:Trp family transcriptional regulator [Candidatus Roizmanbacteria bacterium]MCR4313415.1 Trp family transcriptional regulator [Candidatus Roizmanbacteria bacterium]
MVRISYLQLKAQDYEKIFSIFYKVLGETENKDEFNKILFDLLTPAERIMIIKRIAIIYLLLKEIDYRMICRALKVSNTTVNKFKLSMEKSEGIVPALRGMVKQEKVWLFFEEIFSQIFYPGRPGINWTAAWETKLALERKKERGL